MPTLKKGRAETHAKFGRHTGDGTGKFASLVSMVDREDANFPKVAVVVVVGVISGEGRLLALQDSSMCLRENFLLALSKVLMIRLSESPLVSLEGGVTSGLGRCQSPSSCPWREDNSPGALAGLLLVSEAAWAQSSPAVGGFDDLEALKGSSKHFLFILVEGRVSSGGSISCLGSLVDAAGCS